MLIFHCSFRYFALWYALILLLAIHSKDIESNTSVLMLLFFLSFKLNFQSRVIHYKAEGRLHKFEWVYDGTAWDVESGTSVKDKHHRSAQGAIENAVKRLIEELRARKILS